MGAGLFLLIAYEMARVTALQLGDMAAGRADRASTDRRLQEWAARVIERARIQLTVRGVDRVPRGRAFVYMSNHQSHIDVPVLYSVIPARTLRMVAKSELFRVPGFGRAIRFAEMVEVKRESRTEAIASLRGAAAAIASGVSIWIAPEGTRSQTGELGPLKRGGFHMAMSAGADIVPIAIDGTFDILPPHTTNMSYDVPVTVEIGAPIPVAGKTVEQLTEEVRAFLAAHIRPRPAV